MEQEKGINERILRFMKAKDIGSGNLADRIGVQRSSISHILSGRNKPSYDFIRKFLAAYPDVNAEWLLLGVGQMLKTPVQKGLFDQNDAQNETVPGVKQDNNMPPENVVPLQDEEREQYGTRHTPASEIPSEAGKRPEKGKVVRVILLYDDGRFDSYVPRT